MKYPYPTNQSITRAEAIAIIAEAVYGDDIKAGTITAREAKNRVRSRADYTKAKHQERREKQQVRRSRKSQRWGELLTGPNAEMMRYAPEWDENIPLMHRHFFTWAYYVPEWHEKLIAVEGFADLHMDFMCKSFPAFAYEQPPRKIEVPADLDELRWAYAATVEETQHLRGRVLQLEKELEDTKRAWRNDRKGHRWKEPGGP